MNRGVHCDNHNKHLYLFYLILLIEHLTYLVSYVEVVDQMIFHLNFFVELLVNQHFEVIVDELMKDSFVDVLIVEYVLKY